MRTIHAVCPAIWPPIIADVISADAFRFVAMSAEVLAVSCEIKTSHFPNSPRTSQGGAPAAAASTFGLLKFSLRPIGQTDSAIIKLNVIERNFQKGLKRPLVGERLTFFPLQRSGSFLGDTKGIMWSPRGTWEVSLPITEKKCTVGGVNFFARAAQAATPPGTPPMTPPDVASTPPEVAVTPPATKMATTVVRFSVGNTDIAQETTAQMAAANSAPAAAASAPAAAASAPAVARPPSAPAPSISLKSATQKRGRE